MLRFSLKHFLTSSRVSSRVNTICSIELDRLGILSDGWGNFFGILLGWIVPLVHVIWDCDKGGERLIVRQDDVEDMAGLWFG